MCLGDDGTSLLDVRPPPRTLIVSPGLPDDLPLLQAARARGLTVLDEAELGWRLDPRPWVGVTGTNGKSTSVRLIAAVLRAAGATPVLGGNTFAAPPLTATDPNGSVVVAELSSFQLERTECLVTEAALLTQVGTDHLDRHGTRERYAAAKERLFLREDAHVPMAAVGVDDRFGREIAARLRARGGCVRTFGSADADLCARALEWDLDGSTVAVRTAGTERVLRTRLPGPHNAVNVAGALAIGDLLGIADDLTAEAIATTSAPPGRLAHVDVEGDHDVVIDFAKNAAGVRVALSTVRRVVADRGTRVIAVLAAVPPADPNGLFAMGAEAGSGADVVILTVERWLPTMPSDPHPELVRGTRSTAKCLEVVLERREALARARQLTRPGDVLIILGRGTMPFPLVAPNGTIALFDDVAELRALATC
jgi:UDP-N-acetylmuramoylalanine-D-glutamate ligase